MLRSLRSIVVVLMLVVTAGLVNSDVRAAEGASPRLNVLFIASDDMRPELGCYGQTLIKTPHLDRLASQGVRFAYAFCQYPLCNPSRTSMLTGRHPLSTGVQDNTRWFRAEHPEFITLPQHFKANGYATLRSGKIFHGGIDDTDAWTEGGEKRQFEGADRKRTSQQRSQSDRIVSLDGDGESHGDYKITTRAIELLEQYKNKPFFLAYGVLKPHSPPTAPQKMIAMYDPSTMRLPPDFQPRPTIPAGFPELSVPLRNGDLFIDRDATPEQAREMTAAYFASTTFADAQIGRVLDALERLNLCEKTVIVFFGDHGYHLGEKGKWSKHGSLFEIGTRVPMMIVAPGMAGNGKSSLHPVQLLDVYPTLVELCGLKTPPGLEGNSLVSLLKDPGGEWQHPAFSVCRVNNKQGRAVRTARFRYVEWENGTSGAMLFDHQSDPHELINLASNPAHASTVAEMKKLLNAQFGGT
jgi:iduronate 2-sulfatase